MGKRQAASLEKAKKNNRAPPPMLTRAEWIAAFEIHGAKDARELGEQFIMAKQGEFVDLELRWRTRGASNAEVKKRLGQANKVRKDAEYQEKLAANPATHSSSWASGKKIPKPPAGLMFRYLERAKEDGQVLPMSQPLRTGVREEFFDPDRVERKLISASKGGSNNQRLLGAAKKKSK